jgi:Domain of unknown function (DUF4123)
MQALNEAALQNPSWNWYAIADSAQHKALPEILCKESDLARCLLDAPSGSPLAAKAPHLVLLSRPTLDNFAWKWIARNAHALPCMTVIASELDFDQLFDHFQPFTEVLLPDGDDMFFAFWDPAILATLVGQTDDPTLYVKGPVLSERQRSTLTQGIAGWWYWDREGTLRSLPITIASSALVELPLKLTQQQVDDLVEASVPDNLLSYINENQPELLLKLGAKENYKFVCQQLTRARTYNIEGTGDLVNYTCIAFAYGAKFDESTKLQELLLKVKAGVLILDEALDQITDAILEEFRELPRLL